MKPFVDRYLTPRIKSLTGSGAVQITIVHAAQESWTATSLKSSRATQHGEAFRLIQRRARMSYLLGEQPLWHGYADARLDPYPLETGRDATRTPLQVSTPDQIGRLFTQVTVERKPHLVVEVGTAFGVSGMYWLAGLEFNGSGHLLTFEPNDAWAETALANLAAIGSRFELVTGTFEDNLAAVDAQGATIDIAFIDAIHTRAIVMSQFELVRSRSAPGALIFFDDIDFSDDMHACWTSLASDAQFAAAAEIGRVGLLELRRDAPPG
ncbi:MAG TPA: class I SAM-dependent methyltransferase [Candidatus Limnocylindrales bacterium]|nr:class I SAM-dependent methyltransferase [Candidatus Limnocylindrales bacterium]